MNKIIHKTIICIFLCFMLNNKIFASNITNQFKYGSKTYNNYHSIKTWNYTFSTEANAKINSIRFEQNDNYYYLFYDIDYTSNTSYNTSKIVGHLEKDNDLVNIYQTISPGNIILTSGINKGIQLYLTEKNDKTQTTYDSYGEGSVSANQVSTYFEYEWYMSSSGSRMKVNVPNNYLSTPIAGLESLYYTKYSFIENLYNYYLCKNDGATITQNSKLLSNNTWSYNYNGKITIPKSKCNEFRYLQLNAPTAILTSYSDKNTDLIMSNISASYIGIYGTNIDLMPYLKCDNHHFDIINNNDKKNHELYCANCNWKTYENHNFIYEYDGIINNLCECKYAKKIKNHYEIFDNFIASQSIISEPNVNTINLEYNEKTGYNFLWYENYEKIIDNINISTLSEISNKLVDIYIGTISNIPKTSGYVSKIYKAVYQPIEYYFDYNNENNQKLTFEDNIQEQKFIYDEASCINENLHATGYSFDGWSIGTTSNIIDVKPKQEICNFTNIDNKHYSLYPNYSKLKFIVEYNTGLGKFINNKKSICCNYKYFDNDTMLLPYGYEGGNGTYFVCYKDKDGNKYKNMSDIKTYIDKNGKNDYVLKLYASFDHPSIGKIERSTNNKDDLNINKNNITNNNNIENNIKEQENILINNSIYNNINNKINNNKENLNNGDKFSEVFGLNLSYMMDIETLKKILKISTNSIITNNTDNMKQDSIFRVITNFFIKNFMMCIIIFFTFFIIIFKLNDTDDR